MIKINEVKGYSVIKPFAVGKFLLLPNDNIYVASQKSGAKTYYRLYDKNREVVISSAEYEEIKDVLKKYIVEKN